VHQNGTPFGVPKAYKKENKKSSIKTKASPIKVRL